MSRHAAAVAAPVIESAAARPAPRPVPAQVPASLSGAGAAGAIGAFARLPAGSVIDPDTQRALATQRLLAQLAPALGIDPARLRIECHSGTIARLDAAGANGLQEGAAILLHPGRYRPGDAAGRGLLAHEAAHVAQRALAGVPDEAEAEAEAATIAEAFARGARPRLPRIALRTSRAAADAGAAAGVTRALRPAPDTDTVALTRAREIAAIHGALKGWWVSDGDVFSVLEILEAVPYPVIRPLLLSLSEADRFALADNINAPHVRAHRSVVLACYHDTLSDRRLSDALDLRVFRSLPAYGLTTEDTIAAAWVLEHIGRSRRLELLRSDNHVAIERIIAAPHPSAAELDRIAREADVAATEEARQFEKRIAVARIARTPDANALLDRLKALLSDSPSAATAREALDLLGAGSTDDARFLFLAESLEDAKLLERMIELLPPTILFDTPKHGETLFALVRSRLPGKNEALIERLLSRGLHNFLTITDNAALFAYKIIKALPIAAQYKFRLRDGGKWYLRLLEQLPTDKATQRGYPGIEIRKAETRAELDELKKQGASGIDDTALLYNASELHEKKFAEKGTTAALQALIDAFKEAERGIFRDAEAKDLYRLLVALGASSIVPGKERPTDRLLREAVVHELDRLGYIEELFGQLPTAFLYAEENRISTVRIMLARDPSRVRAHARDLVSRGATDWMVTSGEAWLAFQCIKALPPDERTAFITDEAEQWGLIQEEMSAAQRRSRDLNLYIGDEAGTDRASVLGQLADAETWTEANAGLLGNLIRMAIAMTEHRFAFERSREFKAITQPELLPLVVKYRLWDPVTRPVYSPELLRGSHWYEEGPFQTIRTIGSALLTVWRSDMLFVRGGVGAKIDLGAAQGLFGGDLMGAQLADPAKRDTDLPKRHPDANKLIVIVGTDRRSAQVRLPELELQSANIQLGGSTMQSGRVLLRGLEIRAGYDSDSLNQPTQASAKVESVVAEDMLLAKTNSMVAVSRLLVAGLRLAAGTIDTIAPGAGRSPREHAVPFPLMVPALLALLVLVALPIYLYKKIAGLFAQGYEGNMGAEMAADVAERTKAISFTLDSLDVEGVTTSGGQHVEHIAVRDVAIRVGLNKATRLRAEERSLSARTKALGGKPEASQAVAALMTRRAEVGRQIADLAKDEAEYVAIGKQIRAGGLSAEKQKALQARLDALKFEDEGGAFTDIGSIEASGLRGQITASKPIRVAGIHGEGGGAALAQLVALPTVTPEELSRRSEAGERPGAALGPGQPGALHFELGDIQTGEIRIGQGLRTVADIDRQLAKLAPRRTAAAVKPLYDSLVALRVKAERHEALVQHGLSQLDPIELNEFRGLRRDLAAQADLIVESINVVQATLDADVATGAVSFGAASLKVSKIDSPSTGISIDELIVRGLGLRAVPRGGLLGFGDWKQNIRDIGARADSVTVSGVRSKYHGLLFEKATLTGGYARLRDRGDKIELGLRRFSVENVGIAPRIGLLEQQLFGLREQARIATGAKKSRLEREVAKLAGTIIGLQQLVDDRLAAYAALEAATDPAAIAAAKDKVIEADSAIAIGLAQYGATSVTLDEFGVAVRGGGDLLTDALGAGIDPLAVLKRGGVTVQGTGPDKRLFKRFAAVGAQTSSDAPVGDASLAAETGRFEVGETRLDVKARQEGDSIFVDVPDFAIGGIALERFLLTSVEGDGGVQLYSTGKSGLEGIRFQGSVRLDSRVKDSRNLADFRLAHVHIDMFRIARIFGAGLGFGLIGEKLEVAIKSGSISGIHADGIDIDIPAGKAGVAAAPIITGTAGIDSIDNVIVEKAVAGAWQVDGGRINAKRVEAAFVKDGGIEASVGALNLIGVGVRGPDGWLRFSLSDFATKLSFREGVLDVRELSLGRFEVPAIDWKVGPTGFVKADRPVALTDFSLKARIELAKADPKKPKPDSALAKVTIQALHVGGFEARHLIYQDEVNRIEIGPDETALPKHMKGFKPLELRNLDVWGLEWKPGEGVSRGKASLGSYEGSLAYEGLKSGLKAGVALKGGGMKAEISGPGAFGVDFGRVEKVRGTYGDGKIDTKFATGAITGSVAFGPDFVEARDIEIAGINLGSTTFRDGPTSAKLGHLFIEKTKIGKARQNLLPSADPAKPGEKVPGTLEIENVALEAARADRFTYDGRSTKLVAGKEIASTQHIEGDSATIKRLMLGKIEHDAATAKTVLSAVKLDAGENAKSYERPFAINGLAATFVSGIGDKPTTVKLLTDVEAGPLTAEKISFQTADLGTEPGPDGKPRPVTGTRIEGGFDLTKLGLVRAKLTVEDETGLVLSASAKRLELKGLHPRLLPNGTAFVSFDELAAHGIHVKAGAKEVDVDFAALRKVAATLEGLQPGQAFEILGATLDGVKVEGVKITYEVDRSAPSKPDEPGAAASPEKWVLDALAGLGGSLSVHIAGAPVVGDVDLPVPIKGGMIDFGDLEADDGYFPPGDVRFFISNRSIIARGMNSTLKVPVVLYDSPTDIPGVSPAKVHIMPPMGQDQVESEYVESYGQLNLREFVEGTLNAPADPDAAAKPAKALDPILNRISIKGSLKTVDGKVGKGKNSVELTGAAGGKNVATIDSAGLGSRFWIGLPHIQASRGHFQLMGKPVETGEISASVSIALEGLAGGANAAGHFTFNIVLTVADGKVSAIKFGDVSLATLAAAGARPDSNKGTVK